MSEPTGFQKFPPKRARGVQFERLYHRSGGLVIKDSESGKYCAKFPSVYSTELPNQYAYAKLWDHFSECYFEGQDGRSGFEPLISWRQYSLYNYLTSLSNRGYYVSIKGRKNDDGQVIGLAALTGIRRPWLIDDLDHLEDCLLIHRVRRLDLHGQPNEIVIHTPFTPQQLRDGKYDLIRDRIARRATKQRREQAKVRGEKDGQPFAYVTRNTAPGFWFDYNYFRSTFGEQSQRFADFALRFFRKNFHYLKTDKSAFEADYRDDLGLELNVMEIRDAERREKCFKAAGVFRKIYCPTLEEICA
jgi:hypothetical protein